MENEIQEIDYSDTLEMLKDIINNKELNYKNSLNRRVIFWYDSDREYSKVIDRISEELSNNDIEVIQYENNSFKIRYRIEIEEPNKNFVIYFPFMRKSPIENDLLDLEESYGYESYFNPDNTTKIIVELGLSDDNRSIIQENKKFFGNQIRRDKFKEFDSPKNNATINHITTAICLGSKNINEDDLIKQIFKTYYLEKNKFKQLQSFGNFNFVVELLYKCFGFKIDSYDNLDEMICNMILTYFVEDLKDKSNINKYGDCIIPKKSNAQIFINNIMNDTTTMELYEKLSKKVFDEFGLDEYFSVDNANDYINNDAFDIIDKNIIINIINQLKGNSINYDSLKEMIIDRQSKFWYKKFENEYKCLLNCIEYLRLEKIDIQLIKTMDIENLTKMYSDELYKLDTLYRKSLYYFDKIKDDDEFKDLLDLLDNHYSNNFMFELSIKWDDALEKLPKYDSNSLLLQNKFFNNYIKPEINNSKAGRVFVIISDAFRYELAHELNDNLIKLAKNSNLEYMLGLVPSYTKLGKAALLPNNSISMIENSDDVLVDGMKASSTNDRENILKTIDPNSYAYQFSEINGWKTSDLKENVKGKKVIYIYHDVVDKTGESNDDKVFEASQNAIEEIYDFIEKIHKTFSGVNVYITADHGFFYRRGEIKPQHKVSKNSESDKTKTRYSYSKKQSNDDSLISIKLDYIFDNYEGYVEIPRGHNVFAKQGLTDKYYHGGALPQELIIPVIDFKSARGSKEQSKVGIVYSGLNNKITNTITYLTFTQNKSVDEENLPCNYVLYFEDENGEKISNEVRIVANKTEKDYNDRIFKEKFIFKSIKYSYENNYNLIIKEEGQKKNYATINFDIDIAFANEFDF